jgi:hypothetical protein
MPMSFQIQACIAALLLACAGFAMAEPEPLRAESRCDTARRSLAYEAGMTTAPCAEQFFAAVAKKIATR